LVPSPPPRPQDADGCAAAGASLPLGGQREEKSAGRFIAVGAGRGGVGKSLVAVNLAVYFAQLGKTVALVDSDAGGSNLHAHFGLSAARV
jgi:Mrp family chromosome partitioning ATPase